MIITRLEDNYFKINTNQILKSFYNNYKKIFTVFNKHDINVLNNKSDILMLSKYKNEYKKQELLLDKISKDIIIQQKEIIILENKIKEEKKFLFQTEKYKTLLIELKKSNFVKNNITNEKTDINNKIISLKNKINLFKNISLEEINSKYNLNNDFNMLFVLLENKKIYLETFSNIFLSLGVNSYNDEDFFEKYKSNDIFKNIDKSLTIKDFLLSNEINLIDLYQQID